MFVTKAIRGKNDWWRYLLVLLSLLMVMSFAQMIALFALPSLYPEFDVMQLMDGNIPDDVDKNVIYFFLVLPFAISFLAMYLLIPLVHDRPFASLFEPSDRIQWIKPLKMAGVFILFLLAFETLHYLFASEDYVLDYAGWPFWVTVFLSVFLLYFQTAWEELVFRSYLYQGLGMWLRRRWLAIFLSSVFFAGMHMANPEAMAYDVKMLFAYYFLTGAFLGILVVMEDNIYLAWAFHLANNFIAAVFFSYEGAALNTYALFRATEVDMSMLLPSSFFAFLILLLILKRIRGWPDWSLLWTPVVLFEEITEGDSTFV
mgnify:FL=1